MYWTKQINFLRIFFSKHNSKTARVPNSCTLRNCIRSNCVYHLSKFLFLGVLNQTEQLAQICELCFCLFECISARSCYCIKVFMVSLKMGFLGISFDGDPDLSLFSHYFSFLRISFPGGLFHVDALHTFFFEDDKVDEDLGKLLITGDKAAAPAREHSFPFSLWKSTNEGRFNPLEEWINRGCCLRTSSQTSISTLFPGSFSSVKLLVWCYSSFWVQIKSSYLYLCSRLFCKIFCLLFHAFHFLAKSSSSVSNVFNIPACISLILSPWFQCCILTVDYWICRFLCSFRTGLLFRCRGWLVRLVSLLLQRTCMFFNVSNAIYLSIDKLPLDSINSLNSQHSPFLLVRTSRTSSGFISLSFNILKSCYWWCISV